MKKILLVFVLLSLQAPAIKFGGGTGLMVQEDLIGLPVKGEFRSRVSQLPVFIGMEAGFAHFFDFEGTHIKRFHCLFLAMYNLSETTVLQPNVGLLIGPVIGLSNEPDKGAAMARFGLDIQLIPSTIFDFNVQFGAYAGDFTVSPGMNLIFAIGS